MRLRRAQVDDLVVRSTFVVACLNAAAYGVWVYADLAARLYSVPSLWLGTNYVEILALAPVWEFVLLYIGTVAACVLPIFVWRRRFVAVWPLALGMVVGAADWAGAAINPVYLGDRVNAFMFAHVVNYTIMLVLFFAMWHRGLLRR